MERSKLYRKIEEKIAICGEECEREKENAFLSVIKNSELETLQALYERVKKSESREKLWAELSGRLPELEKAKECEAKSPSFDWYDEHYHYKVLEGQYTAYRSMIELLDAED